MFKKKFTFLFFAAFAFNSLSAQVIVAGGGVNNYTIANYPGNFTNYYDGFSVIFRSNNNCTGPCTMQIGVAAPQPIVNTAGGALVAGDIRLNQVVTIIYDQSAGNFQMITASGNAGGGSSPWTKTGASIYPTAIADNVGIGTNSPVGHLHILSTSPASPRGIISNQISEDINPAILQLAKARGTPALPGTILVNDELAEIKMSGLHPINYETGAAIKATAEENFTTGAIDRFGTNLSFHTATLGGGIGSVLTEKMRISADGNVGIGTSSPFTNLHVAGGISTTIALQIASDAGMQGGIALLRNRNTLAIPTAVIAGDGLGAVNFMGFDGASFGVSGPDAAIEAFAAENFNGGAHGSSLVFFTTPLGAVGSTERMRIFSNGSVGIGGINSDKFQVDVNGNIVKLNNASTSFPVANAAGVLTNDGVGNLSWAVAGGASPWTDGGPTIYPTNSGDSVGIGALAPTAKLHVVKTGGTSHAIHATNSGSGRSVYGFNNGTGMAGFFQIFNAGSAASALVGQSNGSGKAVYGFTNGTGNAGYFEISNAANTATALYATTNGSGLAGEFVGKVKTTDFQMTNGAANTFVLTSDATGNASWQAPGAGITGSGTATQVAFWNGATSLSGNSNLYWDNTNSRLGIGIAAPTNFLNIEPSAPGATDLLKSKTTGTGRAGYFEIDNAASAIQVLYSSTNGTGKAGEFSITNASSASAALFATTNGTGSGIWGTTTGSGYAGRFTINNGTNSNPALYVNTIGLGNSGQFNISNGGNGSSALTATTNGLGNAGYFQIANAGNSASALYATTNGSGLSGEFVGKLKTTDFQMTNGAANTFVLTSDATGNASWQAPTVGATPWTDGGTTIYPTNSGDFVGIGIVPTEKFEVAGTAKIISPNDPLIVRTTTDGFGVRIRESDDGNDAIGLYGYATRGRIFLKNNGANSVDIDASGNSYFNGGNVGIGTTTPQNLLDVEGGAVIGAAYSGTNAAPANGLLVEGAVGIGNNNPSVKLDVTGNIAARNPSTDSYVIIDAIAGQSAVIGFRRNNLARWKVFTDNVAEGGGNVGSDFKIDAYDDAGTGIATYLFMKRSNGNVGIGTTGPLARLHLSGNIGGPTVPNAASSSGVIRIATGSGALDIGQMAAAPQPLWMQAGSAGTPFPLSLQPSGGNVGVGETEPSMQMHLSGDLGLGVATYSPTPAQIITSATAGFPNGVSVIQFTNGANNFTVAGLWTPPLPGNFDGKMLILVSTGSGNMTVSDESVSETTPIYRLSNQGAASVTTTGAGSVILMYCAQCTGSGGGFGRWLMLANKN